MKGSIRVLDYCTIFCIIYFRNSPLILYLIFNFVVRYYQSQHFFFLKKVFSNDQAQNHCSELRTQSEH